MKKLLWLDTETTGLNPKVNGLREVAFIIVINDIEVEKVTLFIDPRSYKKDIEINNEALELSGKTVDMFDSYGRSDKSFELLIETLDKHINKEDKEDYFTLAGYNTKFDNDFLKEWFNDNGHGEEYKNYIHYKMLDVFSLVMPLKHIGLIKTVNDKLQTICNYFSIPIKAHEAMGDIEATKKLYETIIIQFFNSPNRNFYNQESTLKELFELRRIDLFENKPSASDENSLVPAAVAAMIPYLQTKRLIGNIFAERVPTLREIEFAIKDWFIEIGYDKLCDRRQTNWFITNTELLYKDKCFRVEFYVDNISPKIFRNTNSDELFKEVYNYFKNKKIVMPETCPNCGSDELYDPNPRTDNLGPYCDNCGEKIYKIEG